MTCRLFKQEGFYLGKIEDPLMARSKLDRSVSFTGQLISAESPKRRRKNTAENEDMLDNYLKDTRSNGESGVVSTQGSEMTSRVVYCKGACTTCPFNKLKPSSD